VVQLPEFERKQQEIQQKQTALEQQLEQLEISAEQRKALMELFPSIENFCQQVQPVLQEATFAQRRHLIELLIDRVIVTDDEVEIRYVIPTHPDGPQIPFIHLRTNYR
jgi:site-specific DNA recombinase